MKNKSVAAIVFILAPMVIALAFAMDIYIPAVPGLAKLFHVSAGELQWTLTSFMITCGVMQLIVGPYSDQVGRRLSSFVVVAIFAVGSVLCSMATTAAALIAFRIIQATGACGMFVISFAVVRDLFHGNKSAKVYSYLNGLMAFSPMFAPFIGSYLDIHFGWRSTFLFLIVLVLWSFAGIFFWLKETLPKSKRITVNLNLFQEYRGILKNKAFIWYTLATAFGVSYLYLFFSISPYIIIKQLHIPESHYGYYFCFMGVSFFVGSYLSAQLVEKLGVFRTVMLGFIISLIGGIWMAAWYWIDGLTIGDFIFPMLLIGTGGTMGMGAGNGGLMEPFGENAGAASALSGSIRFLLSAVVGIFAVSEHVASTLPLAIPAIIFNIVGIVGYLIYKRSLQF